MEQSNEKKQTALMMLESFIEDNKRKIMDFDAFGESFDVDIISVSDLYEKLTTLLEVERAQICDAYDIGSYSGLSGGAGTSEYYFTQTFKSE